MFAGLVTSQAVSLLGAVIAISGAVGWFRDVLPHEAHEDIPVTEESISFVPAYEKVARIEVDKQEIGRLIVERERVAAAVRAAGYKFVSADLDGYSSGNINRTWKPEISNQSS